MENTTPVEKITAALAAKNQFKAKVKDVRTTAPRQDKSTQGQKESAGISSAGVGYSPKFKTASRPVSADAATITQEHDINVNVDSIEHAVTEFNKNVSRSLTDFSKVIEDLKEQFDGFDKTEKKKLAYIEGTYSKLVASLKYGIGGTIADSKKEFPEDKGTPLTEQKGFIAAIRRGIVDVNKDLKEDTFGGRIGKLLGSALGRSLDNEEREDYSEKMIYPYQEHKRALSENPEELTRSEERGLKLLRASVMRGEQDLGGKTQDEYMESAKKNLVWEKNLSSVKKKETTADFNAYIEKHKDLIPAELLEQYLPDQEVNVTPTDTPKSPLEVKPPLVTDQEGTEDRERDELYVTTPEGKTETELVKSVNELISVLSRTDIEARKIKKLNLDQVIIKSMGIGSLSVESVDGLSVESVDGLEGGAGGSGFDIDIDRRGKKGRKAPKGAKVPGGAGAASGALAEAGMGGLSSFLLGAAPLLAIAEASREAEAADINNTEDFNIFASVGRMGKSLSEGLSSFFGSPTDSAEVKRIKEGVEERGAVYSADEAAKIKEKYGYEVPASSITQNDVTPLPDQKQNELMSAKAENDHLVEAQKDAEKSNTVSNINVNAPTMVSSGNSGAHVPSLSVRPTHSAYERFVDRVFTAL